MKLLLDMDPSPQSVGWQASAGYKAVHWASIGSEQAPDSDIMAYAKEHGFIVLTQDLDFSAILAASGDAWPSVIQIRADNVSPDAIGRAVVSALRQLEPELRSGAFATVDPVRTRMSVLPLRRDD